MPKLKKKIRVVEPHQLKDYGQAEPLGTNRYLIKIHPKHRTERSRMNTVVHESLHCGDMAMSEKKVRHLTAVVVEVLWAQGYRRVRV
jgi:hypothetical protein